MTNKEYQQLAVQSVGSYARLARMIGVKRITLYNMINRNKNISAETAYQISKALSNKITVRQLLLGDLR